MRAFTLLWLGQLASLLGTGVTSFGITLWAWQVTGEATALAWVAAFTFGPTVLLSPLAGAIVDRFDRKRVMLAADGAAGLATAMLLALHLADALAIWHLYALGAFTGAFSALHFPAYAAAVTTLVDKSQYGRASGMLSLADAAANVAAPVLGAALVAGVGLRGVLLLDLLTCAFALTVLAFLRIPAPTPEPASGRARWGDAMLFGFRFILERPALLQLQLVFTAVNFLATMGGVALAPMILARTDSHAPTLAAVQAALGAGAVVGAALLAMWGITRRRVAVVFVGMILEGLLGSIPLGLGRSLTIWLPAALLHAGVVPILNGANQALWQSKVPAAMQGRVFSARRMIAQLTSPLSMLLVGPLIDRVLEPGMGPGGALAPVFGPLVGVGPGAGIALLQVLVGVAVAAVAFAALTRPRLRNLERDLPDAPSVRDVEP